MLYSEAYHIDDSGNHLERYHTEPFDAERLGDICSFRLRTVTAQGKTASMCALYDVANLSPARYSPGPVSLEVSVHLSGAQPRQKSELATRTFSRHCRCGVWGSCGLSKPKTALRM